MKIYIASSWKNQHAVEMLTAMLRKLGHEVLSFVENNHGEFNKAMPLDEWIASGPGDTEFRLRHERGDAKRSRDLYRSVGNRCMGGSRRSVGLWGDTKDSLSGETPDAIKQAYQRGEIGTINHRVG